jgi:AcrR family transcriptional regulator
MPESEISSPKRDHLMATAWWLFYRDGFRAVGIDLILAEAGVAKMTLYNHFASKEELIVALLEKRDRELRASIVATVEAAGKSPTKRLLAVFDWLEDWFGGADFNGCVFIRALSEYPEATHAIHRTAWNHKVAVKQMLTSLCDAAGGERSRFVGRDPQSLDRWRHCRRARHEGDRVGPLGARDGCGAAETRRRLAGCRT